MEFCKYEFINQSEWLDNKKKIEQTIEIGGSIHTIFTNCSVVELGHIVITPAIIENMVVIEEAKLSNKYCVDILWDGSPLADFINFEVFPEPCGIHTFAGMEAEYEQKYYNKYPELRPINNI